MPKTTRTTATTRATRSRRRTTRVPGSETVHLDLRAGETRPTMVRANPEALAKAKAYLGYRSNQEMVIDLIQSAVDDKAFREQRVTAQRKALTLLDDLDLTGLAEATKFRPVEQAQ